MRVVAVISFCGSLSNQVTRLLTRHNINSHHPSPKPKAMHDLLRTSWCLNVPGVYEVPCMCYIGPTGRMVSIQVKEHQSYLKVRSSGAVCLGWCMGHTIGFGDTALM